LKDILQVLSTVHSRSPGQVLKNHGSVTAQLTRATDPDVCEREKTLTDQLCTEVRWDVKFLKWFECPVERSPLSISETGPWLLGFIAE
jgi:hypothetical protein